jgi:hypothetical protein
VGRHAHGGGDVAVAEEEGSVVGRAMEPYRRGGGSAEVRSEERRRWRSGTREQLLGRNLPAAEHGGGAGGSGGARERGREGALLAHCG